MNRNSEINQGLYEWELDNTVVEKPFNTLDKTVLILFLIAYGLYFSVLLLMLFGGFYRDFFGTVKFSSSLLYYRFDPIKSTGLILLFVGFLWIWLQAFKESLAYGIIMSWLPLLMYMHVYLYFKKAKWPFLLHFVGILLMFIGK